MKRIHSLLLVASFTLASAFSPVATPPSTRTFSLQMSEAPKEVETRNKPNSYVKCGRCQTVYAVTADQLGERGRRLECSVCEHSWYQSSNRLMELRDGLEMVALSDTDLQRIALNLQEGRAANFMGESKLYVGNIAFECSEQDLQEIFGEAGEVGDVSLVRDDIGRNRGFGFITMRTKEGGERARELLDGKEVKGRNIAVRESNSD